MTSIEYSYTPRLFDVSAGEDWVGQLTWVDETTGEPIVYDKPCLMVLTGDAGETIEFRTDVDAVTQPCIITSSLHGLFQFTAPASVTRSWPAKTYQAVLWATVPVPATAADVLPFSRQRTEVCRGLFTVRPAS